MFTHYACSCLAWQRLHFPSADTVLCVACHCLYALPFPLGSLVPVPSRSLSLPTCLSHLPPTSVASPSSLSFSLFGPLYTSHLLHRLNSLSFGVIGRQAGHGFLFVLLCACLPTSLLLLSSSDQTGFCKTDWRTWRERTWRISVLDFTPTASLRQKKKRQNFPSTHASLPGQTGW